jgi:hypothetical protein
MPMSDAECARTSLGFLKKMLTTIALVGLLGIVSLGSGVCQTPGYGEKPDEWAPYERGRYFEQLQEIVKIYEFAAGKITYLHFETPAAGSGAAISFLIYCFYLLFSSWRLGQRSERWLVCYAAKNN